MNTSQILEGKKVAVLVADGFEQSEFEEPIKAVEDAGGTIEVVSLKSGKVKAWKDKDWGKEFNVDKTIKQVSAADYDALILPGGVINPDLLRNDEGAVSFVKDFFDADGSGQKVVAAICHGPWTLINAEVVNQRRMTSYSSIKQDLINAGADWVDESVVVDNGLVTSRSPKDLKDFNAKLIEEISEGKH